jgi:hypothetical protein
MLQSSVDFASPHLSDELKALKNKQVPHKEAVEWFSRYFSLVLYLCSSDQDIIQTSRTRKAQKTKNPKKQKRKSPTSGKAGGLKNVNRSKRLNYGPP